MKRKTTNPTRTERMTKKLCTKTIKQEQFLCFFSNIRKNKEDNNIDFIVVES